MSETGRGNWHVQQIKRTLPFVAFGLLLNVAFAWADVWTDAKYRQVREVIDVLKGRPSFESRDQSRTPYLIHTGQAGAPFAAFMWEEWSPSINSMWREGICVRPHTCLPVKPLWAGMMANTLLYSICAGGTFYACRQLRRNHRRRRNQCPQCGYSLSGLPDSVGCPECGSDLFRSEGAAFDAARPAEADSNV